MILYPAIDLKQGAVVRLTRGEMDTATVFGTDPAAQARAWQAAGFPWLHVVDLDGAFAGESANGAAVAAILKAVTIPVQLGGGIRNRAAIEAWLEAGIARVVLGTAAVRNPALLRAAAKAFPGRIAVGIDARGGRVAVEGWAETTDLPALDLAKAAAEAGVAALIFTDVARDGTGAGLNVAATADLARAVGVPVIASGGLSGLEDLRAAQAAGGIAGVICGRALYDGRLDPAAALALAGA